MKPASAAFVAWGLLALTPGVWSTSLEAQQALDPYGSASSAARVPSASSVPAGAQTPADTVAPPVSPGGAFLRSLLVPGWGQAATGSHTRAGFYFATSAATGWMLVKTARFLDAAERRRDLLEEEARLRLERSGVTDPDTVDARLEENPRIASVRGLVEARSQQMEDWTAFGLFWLLLNAADAFVSAHLADFPEPVEVDVRSGAPGRPMELRVSVPVGGGPDRGGRR